MSNSTSTPVVLSVSAAGGRVGNYRAKNGRTPSPELERLEGDLTAARVLDHALRLFKKGGRPVTQDQANFIARVLVAGQELDQAEVA